MQIFKYFCLNGNVTFVFIFIFLSSHSSLLEEVNTAKKERMEIILQQSLKKIIVFVNRLVATKQQTYQYDVLQQ